jgi:type I restriction enzyme R subunit
MRAQGIGGIRRFWSLGRTSLAGPRLRRCRLNAFEFLETLFGALPEFFKTEDDLRVIWSVSDTRKALLAGLADKGFGPDALSEMQRVIDAENRDIFDVPAYVAFALDPLSRVKRAADARGEIRVRYTDRQQAFLDFVLDHYTKQGVGELDGDKLKRRRSFADTARSNGQESRNQLRLSPHVSNHQARTQPA